MDGDRNRREVELRGQAQEERTLGHILGPIVGGVLAALLYDRTMARAEASA